MVSHVVQNTQPHNIQVKYQLNIIKKALCISTKQLDNYKKNQYFVAVSKA